MFWDACTAMSDHREENENETERQINLFPTANGDKRDAIKRQSDAANALMGNLRNPSKLVFLRHYHVNHSRTVVSESLVTVCCTGFLYSFLVFVCTPITKDSVNILGTAVYID